MAYIIDCRLSGLKRTSKTQKVLDILYDELIKTPKNALTITRKELNALGITDQDIQLIKNSNIIESGGRGCYLLKILTTNDGVENLYSYGKRTLLGDRESNTMPNTTKATKIFEKCLQMDPTHIGTSTQLFYIRVGKKEYEEAANLCYSLIGRVTDFTEKDKKYYLYLLSMLTELPSSSRRLILGLNYDSVAIPNQQQGSESFTVGQINRSRKLAFSKDFDGACTELNFIADVNETIQVEKDLLAGIREIEKTANENMQKLIDNLAIEFADNRKGIVMLDITDEKSIKQVMNFVRQNHKYMRAEKIEIDGQSNVFVRYCDPELEYKCTTTGQDTNLEEYLNRLEYTEKPGVAVYMGIGHCYYQQKKYSEAILYFEVAAFKNKMEQREFKLSPDTCIEICKAKLRSAPQYSKKLPH